MSKRKAETQGSRSGSFNGQGTANPMDGRGRATAAQMAARRLKDSKGHRRRTSSPAPPGLSFGQQNAQHGGSFGSNPSDPSQSQPQQQSLPSFELGQAQQNGIQPNGSSSELQTAGNFFNTSQRSEPLLFGGSQFSSSGFSFGAPQSDQKNPFSIASTSQQAIGASGYVGKIFNLPATSQPSQASSHTIFSQTSTSSHPFKFPVAGQPTQSQAAQSPQTIFSNITTPNHPFKFESTSQPMQEQTKPAQALQTAFSDATTPSNPFKFAPTPSQPAQEQPQPESAQPPQAKFSSAAAPNPSFKFASVEGPPMQAQVQPVGTPQSAFSQIATPKNPFQFTSATNQPTQGFAISQAQPHNLSQAAASDQSLQFVPATVQPAQTAPTSTSQAAAPNNPFKLASVNDQPATASQFLFSQVAASNRQFNFASTTSQSIEAEAPQPVPNYKSQFSNNAFSQGASTSFQLQARPNAFSSAANAADPPPGTNRSSDQPQPFSSTATAAATFGQLTNSTPARTSQSSLPNFFQPSQDAVSQSQATPNIFSDQQSRNPGSSAGVGGFSSFKAIEGGGLQLKQPDSETSGSGSSSIFSNLKNATPNTTPIANRIALPKSFSTPLGEIPPPNSESEAPARSTAFANHFGKDILHADSITKPSSANLFSALGQGNGGITRNQEVNVPPATTSTQSLFSASHLGIGGAEPSKTKPNRKIAHPGKFFTGRSTASSTSETERSAGSERVNNFPGVFSAATQPAVNQQPSNLFANTPSSSTALVIESNSIVSSDIATQDSVASGSNNRNSLSLSTAAAPVATTVESYSQRNDLTHLLRPVPNIPLHFSDTQKQEYATLYRLRSLNYAFAKEASSLDINPLADLSPWTQIYRDMREEILTLDRSSKRRRSIGNEASDAQNGPNKKGKTGSSTSVVVQNVESGGALSQVDNRLASRGLAGSQGVKRKVNEDVDGGDAGKRARVGGLVNYPALAPAGQRKETSQTVNLFSDILKQKDRDVIDNPPIQGEKGAFGASAFTVLSPGQVTSSASSAGPKPPIFGTPGSPSNPESGEGSGASLFKFSTPVQTTGSAPRLFAGTLPTAITSTPYSHKPPTFGGPVNFMSQFGKAAEENAKKEKEKRKAADFDSEDEDEAEWERRDAEEQRVKKEKLAEQARNKTAKFIPGKGFEFIEENPSPPTSESSPGLKLPTFGTPVNFMGQFGKIAEENAETEKEKRKAEDFDSEDEDEAEWERRDSEEQRVKKEKLAEQARNKTAKFIPGKGFAFVEEKPALPTSEFSPGLKLPTFGTPVNFMGQFGKIAEENARTEKEKRKAEDFDSEDEDEAEWERRDAEEQRAKKQRLSEQIGRKCAKLIPGRGFTFVDKSELSTSTELVGTASASSAKPPTFGAVSIAGSSELGKTAEDGAIMEEAEHKEDHATPEEMTRSPTASSPNASIDSEKDQGKGISPATKTDVGQYEPDFSNDMRGDTSAKTTDSESGEQVADSPKGSDETISKVTSRGGLFDRISKDKDGNPVRVLPADGEKTTKLSSTSGINFGQSPFSQTWGSSAGSIFGKSPTSSIGGATSTPSNGTNMFGFRVTPDGDHTWKESSPIKFSTSKAPTFNFTETAPSASATFEGYSEKLPSGNPLVAGGSADAPSPSPSLTVSKPAAGLFGSTPDSPAPSGGSVKSADVGFTFGGPPKSMASLLVPSMATSVNTSRATTPGVTTDTGESANESTTEGEKAEDSKQLNLTTGGPGEEDEDVIFEVRAKVFKYDQESKQYKSHGVGPFRVLRHREAGKARMLLRSDPNGNVALNASLLKEVKYESKTAKFVSVVTASEDGKLDSWQVKVGKNEDAIELARVLEENKSQ
ncbi:MAG: hypothetical protein M1813_006863 [Trichoglossum hirsutum]|nr:MAG: hypothetical protein M1813_006863 [Trichoglossum hirsutum]